VKNASYSRAKYSLQADIIGKVAPMIVGMRCVPTRFLAGARFNPGI